MRFLICATPFLSSPLNGSSSIRIDGSSIIACAIPSLCLIPRLYLFTFFLRSGSSPTLSIVSLIFFSSAILRSDARIFKFLRPDTPGRNPGVSMISPISSGKSISFPTSLSLTKIRPSSGLKKPQMHFIITVFPLPLFPTIPCIFPVSNSWLIP